jgi:CO/xanthine dehydrogenase Mo-binding subunit
MKVSKALPFGSVSFMSTSPPTINALENATGVRIYDLLATPEKIKEALNKRK